MINRVGKGIVDNGRKVGEAVTTTAAGILSHEAKQTDDAKPETKSKKGKRDRRRRSVHRAFGRRRSPLYPGELIDDNGFTIVDRSGAPALPEEEPRPARTGKVEVDDAGFVITDMNAKTAPPPPKKTKTDSLSSMPAGMKPKKRPPRDRQNGHRNGIPIRIPNRRFRRRRPPARRLRKRSSSNPLPHIPPRHPRLPAPRRKTTRSSRPFRTGSISRNDAI